MFKTWSTVHSAFASSERLAVYGCRVPIRVSEFRLWGDSIAHTNCFVGLRAKSCGLEIPGRLRI